MTSAQRRLLLTVVAAACTLWTVAAVAVFAVAVVPEIRVRSASLPHCLGGGDPPERHAIEPAVRFVPGPSLIPTFPLTPSYLPFRPDAPPAISLDDSVQSASYEGPPGQQRMGGSGQDITLTIGPEDPCYPPDEWSKVRAVTVQGYPGRLVVHDDDDRDVLVMWRVQPNRWISVNGHGDWSGETMLRVARGLRPGQQTAEPHWRLQVVPAGYVMTTLNTGSLTLMPPGGNYDLRVEVWAASVGDALYPLGDRISTAARPTWLYRKPGRFVLTVEMPKADRVHISAPDGTDTWDEQRLQTFANGVEYLG